MRWVSAGQGEYSVETVERAERGTTVQLKLKADAAEFKDAARLRALIRKYSDHIAFPVKMQSQGGAVETVNRAKALWTRPRAEIKDDEYIEFYKQLAHDTEDPLTWSHNRVEGKREYTNLLYVPSVAPFDLWNRESPKGVKLYVQRVFITDQATQFLPLYLRFVRGVVDSGLSLNVSREILQKDPIIDSMKSALTKRVLDMLEKLAKNEPEQYKSFWKNFGQVMKEGPAEDFANKEKIAGLLRFASTNGDEGEQVVGLAEYLARAKEGQDKIYYLTGETYAQVKNSPHLEIFRKRGIEVLLLSERVDEWLVGNLSEHEGKALASVAKGELDRASSTASRRSRARQRAETALEAREARAARARRRSARRRAAARVGAASYQEHDLGYQMRELLRPRAMTAAVDPESRAEPGARSFAGSSTRRRAVRAPVAPYIRASRFGRGPPARSGCVCEARNELLTELRLTAVERCAGS